MLKFLNCSFSLIIGLLTMLSCSFETSTYSCDPEVEAWTKANISYYETALPIEVIKLPIDRQLAVYRGLSGEKIIAIWQSKLQKVLQDPFLSTEEKEAYSEAVNYLKPEHFETDYGKKALHDFSSVWKDHMIAEYGWDDEKFFWYTETWMTEAEYKQSVLALGMSTLRVSTRSEPSKGKCDCLSDHYCKFAMGGSTCVTGTNKCEVTERGCGIWGNDECTGYCD